MHSRRGSDERASWRQPCDTVDQAETLTHARICGSWIQAGCMGMQNAAETPFKQQCWLWALTFCRSRESLHTNTGDWGLTATSLYRGAQWCVAVDVCNHMTLPALTAGQLPSKVRQRKQGMLRKPRMPSRNAGDPTCCSREPWEHPWLP